VALDLMTAIATGMSATYAVATDNPVFLDVALLVALISFLGTVAFAQYIRKRGTL
jgi:multicomponent Na+:H+ antiporter subunit F